jgi:hypothetical protein
VITAVLLLAAAVMLAWPWIQEHAHLVERLDRRHYAAIALGAAALISYASRSPASPQPTPAPDATKLDLRGTFVGPDAAADAATTACMCNELADELEWDSMQGEPFYKTGVAFDELRVRTRIMRCKGASLGEKHPRARAAIEEFLNAAAGTSGGPLTPEQRAKWIAAYREVGRAAEAAAR